MGSRIRATEVFTPSEFPTVTYVSRNELALEMRLQNAIDTPGEVIWVSGPSKSGKTVLIEKVVGLDNLITVTGAGVASGDHLWDRVLDWMGVPTSEGSGSSRATTGKVGAQVKGGASIPFLAKAEAGGSTEAGHTKEKTSSQIRSRRGMRQVIDEVSHSTFVLLIDDFHYMDRAVQREVSKQIKEAARQGVKICAASVPHRSDDVVRSNPELRGRVQAIDLDYWEASELRQIGELGFEALNVRITSRVLDTFAQESSGSPQLMQALCLQLCFETDCTKRSNTLERLRYTDDDVQKVLALATSRADYSSLVRRMHTGPKQRGQERKEFQLSDGSVGDVYRAVLLAIASDPPALSFRYADLNSRVENCCLGEAPRAQSIAGACAQISAMAAEMYPDERVIEWEDEENLLELIDPYLRFYLRWAPQLVQLGRS